MKIKPHKIDVRNIVPKDKYIEEYIVDYLNWAFKKDNWVTSFFKRFYRFYDKTLNVVDTEIYLRGIDFVLGFLLCVNYIFIGSFFVVVNCYTISGPIKLESLITLEEEFLPFIFVSPDSYLAVVILNGIFIMGLFWTVTLETRKLHFLHTRIIGLDFDIRLYIYWNKISRILGWIFSVLCFWFLAPGFFN